MPVRFQVDPDFYDHPKTAGMSDSAFSLWVRAGSYSAAKLTDGFVSDAVLVNTLRSATSVADELVERGLWRRRRGGYVFHQWNVRNLTRQRVEQHNKSEARRKRNARQDKINTEEPHVRGQNVRPDTTRTPAGVQPESNTVGVGVGVGVKTPVVTLVGSRPETNARARDATARGRPPDRCSLHSGSDIEPGPCRGCMKAREHAEQRDGLRQRERMVVTRSCAHCDVEGWRIDPKNPHRGPLTPGVRCDHTPWLARQIQEHTP